MAPMPAPISSPPVASRVWESSRRLMIFMARVLARMPGIVDNKVMVAS